MDSTSPNAVPHVSLPDHDLSGIELDMIQMAAQGWTNGEIATRQKTTEQVVKNRWWVICRKIRCRNAKHVIHVATKRGWIG